MLLQIGDRTAQQNAQACDWWDEQAAHKSAARQAEKDALAAHGELVRYQDEMQRSAAQAEADMRRALSKNTDEVRGRGSVCSATLVCAFVPVCLGYHWSGVTSATCPVAHKRK